MEDCVIGQSGAWCNWRSRSPQCHAEGLIRFLREDCVEDLCESLGAAFQGTVGKHCGGYSHRLLFSNLQQTTGRPAARWLLLTETPTRESRSHGGKCGSKQFRTGLFHFVYAPSLYSSDATGRLLSSRNHFGDYCRLDIAETQARTLCGFFFTTVGVLRAGFLEGFASGFFGSI